jgi:NAD+ kinase
MNGIRSEADLIVALGGDGFMLRTLHAMLDRHRPLPVFGMNLGTVGFLMNDWKPELLENAAAAAKTIKVLPLRMDTRPSRGERISYPRSTKSRCCAKRARRRRSR